MEKKIKPKKCRVCQDQFIPNRTTQVVCTWRCAIELNQKKKEKEIRKWQKEKREELMTPGERRNKLQKIFNKYIRLRDKDKPCVSCLKPLGKRYDAGHLYSVGRFPELRFNEMNVHGQCVHCNRDLHGNGVMYRKNIVNRIGEDGLRILDDQVGSMNHYFKFEIEEMTQFYQDKIKEIEKKLQ